MNRQYDVFPEAGARGEPLAVNRGIGWCTHAANPLKYRDKKTGKTVAYCQKISPGCKFCYAERLGKRRNSPDFTVPNLDLVEPFIDDDVLRQILGMRIKGPYPEPHTRPAIFIEDMSDLWGDWVPFEMIDRVMAVASARKDITFQFLTKRPQRLLQYIDLTYKTRLPDSRGFASDWPLPNVLLGFSAEDQPNFDARWQHMRKLAAMGWKVFASIEPQLSHITCDRALMVCAYWKSEDSQTRAPWHPVDRSKITWKPQALVAADWKGLSWGIVGGESGGSQQARQFDIAWMRESVAQFSAANVPLWCKQLGRSPCNGDNRFALTDSHGADWSEWPADLRVRQLPDMSARSEAS